MSAPIAREGLKSVAILFHEAERAEIEREAATTARRRSVRLKLRRLDFDFDSRR